MFVADGLLTVGQDAGAVTVALSAELVRLLSDQLYQSPLKAIEELVVNAYDAEATECRIYARAFLPDGGAPSVVVYDNGIGMDTAGLVDLWHIGRSNKRKEEAEKRSRRKQIGKFGIGKLATYAIANKITYLSRRDGVTLGVTLDFRSFVDAPGGAGRPIELPIRSIPKFEDLLAIEVFRDACEVCGVGVASLEAQSSWTFAVLEDMKEKWGGVREGRLKWVLSTAMPLVSGFKLFLNGEEVQSAKTNAEQLVTFTVAELPTHRLQALEVKTGEPWTVQGQTLRAKSFPSGISGTAIVTRESLHAGKSADIRRSHGFFIRVRGRLVNEEDPLFGLTPLSYKTFNRFRADLTIDDLDTVVTAPREGVGTSVLQEKTEALLSEIFYEARDRYEAYLKPEDDADKRGKEHERNYVSPRLVERPIADVLSTNSGALRGGEADDSWFYLDVPAGTDVPRLAAALYSQPRKRYKYSYTNAGRTDRLVRFDPVASTFHVNADHDLVRAHAEEGQARWLLEDVVTAEALLEVYLREYEVPARTIGEVLERRDALLRSLANDHLFSLPALASALREARSHESELEVAVVAAARGLGFVAKHISGSGEPDGVARFRDYSQGDTRITLEAKASIATPTLAQLDFAGLSDHVRNWTAAGCLLVAGEYPGRTLGDGSAVSSRAKAEKISCWTVDLLARVVEAAESRHITARHVLDIVLSVFSPDDVAARVEVLLAEPKTAPRTLYREVLKALRALEDRLVGSVRTLDMVATEVSAQAEFKDVTRGIIESAVRDLAHASQGALTLSDDMILVHGALGEVERRVAGLTAESGGPRRGGAFREEPN